MGIKKPTVLPVAVAVAVTLIFGASAPANAQAKRKATNGETCTIVGSPKGDRITGTSRKDVICGLGGNDIIKSLGGNDVIDGGTGNDKIYGGTGNDIVFAGTGNDIVQGMPGDDLLSGGSGKDSVDGGTGNDVCSYELKDISLRSCSSTKAGLESLGISLKVTQREGMTIFSGKNSSSKSKFLTYDYASFNLKGQSECGGGGHLGWVLPGESFKFSPEDLSTSCTEWGTFGSLNVKGSSTAIYSLNDSEVKVSSTNQPDLQVAIGTLTGNCLSFTADSASLSGQLRFHLNEYDSKGFLVLSSGIESAPDLAFQSWDPIVVRPGIQTSGCIEKFNPASSYKVVSARVFPDGQ